MGTALVLFALAGSALADDAVLSPAAESMRAALSTRDAGPNCADLDAMSADPVGDLTALVQTVTMPPYVPMRAANCLATLHAEAAQGELVRWVTDDNTAGLARMVFRQLDTLPEAVAVEVGTKGIAGPYARFAIKPLQVSANARLRALVPAK